MNIRTRLHTYKFELDNADEKRAWKELQSRLKDQGLECFASISMTRTYDFRKMLDSIPNGDIELETECLFSNQWNTAPIDGVSEQGLRVFDWARDIVDNRSIMVGHYLEQTDEMAKVRQNTFKCGYCGKQEPAGAFAFCPHCIDSEYLTDDRLYLTRMMPIAGDPERAPLTDAERAHLMPLYKDAQLHGTTERGKARIIKQRANIIAKCEKETNNATAERDGFLWLLDHGIKIDNVIYYDHKEMFSFGWRHPVSDAIASELLDIASEFPFEYEIKSVSKVYSAREAA